MLQTALGLLRALIAALQPHSPVAPRGRIIVEPTEARHCPRLSPADSVLIILGLSLQCHFCVQLSLETPNLSFYSVFGLHARLYKSDQRTLRRRRALRRLVKSPAKAKLRPTAAVQLGILCHHQEPIVGASLMTHRWGAPPLCVPFMHRRQCCQVRWHLSLVARHSSKDLDFYRCILVIVQGLSRAAQWILHSTIR